MDTFTIVLVVALIVAAIAVVAFVLPRSRERKLDYKRTAAAEGHREEAGARHARAEVAEREAQRERAEAELLEARARLHEEGLADDDLDGTTTPRFERSNGATPTEHPVERER